MATVYSEIEYFNTGSMSYRAKLVVSTSETDTAVTISWTASVQMRYAYYYGVGITCEGTTGTGYLTSDPGSTWTNVKSISGTITVDRDTSTKTRTITAKAYGTEVNDYGAADNDSESVSYTVTIPALDNYTVTYNANGGTGAPSSQTEHKGTALTLSSTIPTREGYVFIGWGTSADATSVKYFAGDSYTANAAITLYAIWGYAVTYYRTDGTEYLTSSVNLNGTLRITSTVPPISKGYRFLGWKSSLDNKVYSIGGIISNINESISLFPVIEKYPYSFCIKTTEEKVLGMCVKTSDEEKISDFCIKI